jgi:hypothetical protein
MIHCDEVFEILTRGPFPTGAPSDGIVEAHLTQCDGCRQLADALRPAIELLQEAIAPEESGDLPRYGGAVTEPRLPWSEDSSPSLKTKQKLAVRRANRDRLPAGEPANWPWRAVAKFAAAACIGLVLAGMLRQIVAPGSTLDRSGAQSVAVAAHWRLETDGRQWAVEQHLSAACLEPVAERNRMVATVAKGEGDALRLACCLGCHAAVHDRLMRATQIAGFVQACQACH